MEIKDTEDSHADFMIICSIFSSSELKVHVSFSDHPLSVVCLSFCLLDFYIFHFFSRTAGPILIKVGTNHPYVKGIQNCTNEGQIHSPRGNNSKRVIKLQSSPEPAG
jgi:hypothetical protein